MGVVRKTISLSAEQDAWVKEIVASGEFTNDSEVHRHALKAAQIDYEKRKWLDAALEEGLNSPLIDQTIPEIIAEFKEELRQKGEL